MRGTFSTFALGVKSLMLHKLRSALTTLGILIGVAAVVAMLAIGEGASQAAQEQIKRLGSTNILIQSKKPPVDEDSSSQSTWSANIYGLTYDDARTIESTLDGHVDLVVQVRLTDRQIRVGEQWKQAPMLGTTPSYLNVMGMSLERGRWLSDTDMTEQSNVAVLGGGIHRHLFPTSDPIGEVIMATGSRFIVVGVLETLGRRSGGPGTSIDQCIFIPKTTSRRRFGDTNVKSSGGSFEMERVELHEIKVKVSEEHEVLNAAKVIKRILDQAHPTGDYSMVVPLELLEQARESKRLFKYLLFAIASISLIVGGIGIMNVMLATVTERTREIGIRRALGARKKHIVSQFLVETVVLSGAGGVLGLGVGLLTAWIAALMGNDVLVRAEHPIMAFAISAVVGVCAGLYPAWRAAEMDPVEALRHE